jgi:hypothetical protein
VRLQITSLLFVLALAQPVLADTLSLNDTWVVLDQDMSNGGFFSGSWSWSSSDAVSFRITDLFVASDQFKVYDFGVLVATTPGTPSWSSLPGVTDPFQSPPFTDDPDTAYASGYFSSADLTFVPGSHSITIQDISIPFDATGARFPDGTVAFKAATAAVPEPSTLLTLATGLVCLAVAGSYRKQRSTVAANQRGKTL